MSTPTIAGFKPAQDNGDFTVITWPLAQGEEGDAIQFSSFADRTVQFSGVFGGASVELKGSLDGSNYNVLTDPQGNNINKSDASLEAVTEATRYVKPVVTGGDGTTAIVVTLFVRR